jgi:hypothetical protein
VLWCGAWLSVVLTSCTNVTRLGVGPVVAYPGGDGPSYGDELVLRRGIGTSDFEGISIAEYEARLLVTERTQAVSLGAGYAGLRWVGPALLTLNVTPALGLERCRGKPLGNVGIHGGTGLGFTLAQSLSERPGWQPLPKHYRMHSREYVVRERERTVLTFELTGSVDARGTREPLLTAGFLVGLAFTSESGEFDVPEPTDPLAWHRWDQRRR